MAPLLQMVVVEMEPRQRFPAHLQLTQVVAVVALPRPLRLAPAVLVAVVPVQIAAWQPLAQLILVAAEAAQQILDRQQAAQAALAS